MKPEKFLDDIAQDLKLNQQQFNLREEVFFPLRYDKNRPMTVQHTEIAAKMSKDSRLGPGDYVISINTTSQNVVRSLANTYKKEMENDGVNTAQLLNGQKGQRGTWRVAYEWLWNYKYPRWLEANSWQILQEKATSPLDWIKFLTKEEAASVHIGNKGLILPPPPPSVQKTHPTIPAKQSLWMAINFQVHNHQLLLLNRSQDGQNLLCPSSAYAPISIIEKPPIVLPQKDSWAGQDDSQTNFKFDLGKEEFLAIALEKPLNLPWLNPRDEEALIVWNGERIKELFEELEKQNNWQVFYQSFDVVESEKNLLPC